MNLEKSMYVEKCKTCGASINIIHEVNECPYCGTHNSLYQIQEKEKVTSTEKKSSVFKIVLAVFSLLLAGGIASSLFFFLPLNKDTENNSGVTLPAVSQMYTSPLNNADYSSSDVSGNESYIITIVSKLKARSYPSLTAPVVKLLNVNTKLEIIEVNDNFETIDNIESHWIKVRISDGENGWVFGGYTQNYDENSAPFPVSAFIGKWKCQDCKDSGCSVAFTFSHNRSVQIPSNFCENAPFDISSIKSAIKDNGQWFFNNYNGTFKFTTASGQILSGVVDYDSTQRCMRFEQNTSLKFIHTTD